MDKTYRNCAWIMYKIFGKISSFLSNELIQLS